MGQCPQSFVSVPPYCMPAYVPAITNGGIFESLSISEYQRIKGPFPIGRSAAEIKLLLARAAAAAVDHKRDWSINATESPQCVFS